MQTDYRKLENDLNIIYGNLDSDPEIIELLSNENQTIQNTLDDQASKRAITELNLWFQVENLRKINNEQIEGARIEERTDDLSQLMQDVLYFFGSLNKNYGIEYDSQVVENLESNSQIFKIQDYSTVRGFDIEQEVNMNQYLDEEDMDFFEEEEKKMVSNYYYAYDLIKQRYVLEMERQANMDLEDPFSYKDPDYQDELDQVNNNTTNAPKYLRIYFGHFKKLSTRLRRPREDYLEQLVLIFEGLSRSEWEAYDSYWEHCKFQKLRKKAMLREFVREQKRLKAKTESLIAEHLRDKAQAMMTEDEHNKQMGKIKELHQRQEVQRDDYSKKIEEIDKVKEEQIKNKQMLMEKKQKQYEKHAKVVKDQVKRYVTEKQLIEQEKTHKTTHLKNKIINDKKRMIIINQPTVKTRQDKQITKMVKIREECIEKKNEADNRVERINNAIENYKCRPQVDSDFNRLVKDTEGIVNYKKTKVIKPMYQAENFSIEHMMNDMRFKLSTALFEAGVQNTNYAQAVLAHVSKRE